MQQAMLIDYEFCTGCHSCETACKAEKELGLGQYGIKVFQSGPWEMSPKEWQFDFIPAPTDLCDLCACRTSQGKMPACVQHCQARVMAVGNVDELAEEASLKPKMVLYTR